MCTYTTLHHSKHGYAAHCRKCKQVKVAFANTILSFAKTKFDDFVRQVDDLQRRHADDPFMDRKSVLIATAARGVTLAFTPNETRMLHQLLKDACNRLRYEELLDVGKN